MPKAANATTKNGRKRRALVVAGMHRSGTSAMTRVLALLGAALPERLMSPHPDNPAGFWESQSVTDFNDEVLQALNSDWEDVFAYGLRRGMSEFSRIYFDRAVKLLQHEFDGQDFVVLKDPRISVLTSFWDQALLKAGFESHYIIMVRNPLEVAESLRSRDGFPIQKSILLWSSYMLAAERDTRGAGRTFVGYDQLLGDWRAVRDRIQAGSGFAFPRQPNAAAAEIESHLDRGLRHHRALTEEFDSRADIPKELKTLYRLVLAATEGAKIDPAAVDALEERLGQAETLVGPSLADLRGRVRKLTKDVVELNVAHAGAREQADSLASRLAKEAEQATSATAQYEGHVGQLYAHIAAVEAERERLRAEADAERERANAGQVELAALAEEAERLRVAKTASDESMAQFERDLQILEDEVDFEIRAVELRANRKVAAADAKRNELAAEVEAQRGRADGLEAEVQSLRRDAERLRAISTASEAKLKAFVQGLDAIEDEVEEMIQALEQRVAQRVQQAAAETEASREQVRVIGVEMEASREQVRALGAELEASREQVRAVTAELDQTRATLQRFRGSVSWRLTRPVRWTGRLFRSRPT